MREDGIDRALVAMHHVEDAVGQARLLEQLGDAHAGRRVALGRFEDESVAAGERDRKHPHRHHRGEVEWRDAGAYADWRAKGIRIDAAPDRLAEFALEQMRDAARELDDLQTAQHLAARIREDLAVLRGNDRRELL